MTDILQRKINELESAQPFECWYLVKQDTSFVSLCYQVEFLKLYKEDSNGLSLEMFIKNNVASLKKEKPNISVSDTHRVLRVAAFFGIIKMVGTNYKDAIITSTFEEIFARCNGQFEKIDTYIDVIQRQIEKMFISSSIDEEYQGIRSEYRLYPVMLLYKVLLELGKATNAYSITIDEYKYLVATTKKYEDFLNTLILIKLLRDSPDTVKEFQKYHDKFDNRLIRALQQLPTLKIESNSIAIYPEKINEVSKKIFLFEKYTSVYDANEYIDFLTSKQSLFEHDNFTMVKNEQNKIINSQSINEKKVDYQIYDNASRYEGGSNDLLYGVPGSGKSFAIKHDYLKKDSPMERLVFHPDYSNSDFIGQILPTVNDDGDGHKNIEYKFVPGPFTRILKEAYQNPNVEHFLIIEEINRGNASAIFGEVFQLLDRKKTKSQDNDDGHPIGTSEYEISNPDIARIVYGNESHKVWLPSNLSIIGTMNTSDQNVFTMDTAFQRRWNMRLISNSFGKGDLELADTHILDTTVTWRTFSEVINNVILDNKAGISNSEDKSLGTHFIQATDLMFKDGDKRQNSLFAEKVIKYLWDDAFKFSREEIFNTDNYNSLEKIIRVFVDSKENDRFNVFVSELKNRFI
jgi:hypothetical protein